METEKTIYCEVLDSKKLDIKPSPPPLPKRNESISVSLFKERNLPGRTSSFLPTNFITNNCQRCRQTSSSKKQIVLALSITVAIFAILFAVFMTLYFTTEAKCRSNDCKDPSCRGTTHNDVCQNCSSVSNCMRSSLPNKSHNCACQNCSVVSNSSKIKNTSNSTDRVFILKFPTNGYLCRYGARGDLDLLEITTRVPPSIFKFLSNNAIQHVKSGKCWNLAQGHGGQVVLTSNCCGKDVAKWRKVHHNKGHGSGFFVCDIPGNSGHGQCFSPWDYRHKKPEEIKYVPGLSRCADWNVMVYTEMMF